MNSLKNNWKTTFTGLVTASGLAGAGGLAMVDKPKEAALSLVLAALGALLKGFFAQDAGKA